MSMAFRPHVRMPAEDFESAVQFYQHAFGMTLEAARPEAATLALGPARFLLEDAPAGPVTLEFETDCLEKERERLIRLGCRLLRLEAPGRLLMEDPYGLTFALVQAEEKRPGREGAGRWREEEA